MASPNPAEILHSLLYTPRFAIIAIDSNDQLQIWSRGAEQMFGWSEEEMLCRPVSEALGLHRCLEDQTEIRLPRKDGSIIDVEIFAGPWRDAAGDRQGTVAILMGVSRHRAMEQKLALVEEELFQMTAYEKEARAAIVAERRFRELLEAAPDAIIEVDREGRILLLNLVTEKVFGYSRDELLGGPLKF